MIKNKRLLYVDPLHIPSEKLIVYFNDEPALMLNKRLLDKQNCWTNLEEIKEVHHLKLVFNKMIEKTSDVDEMRELSKNITECEFYLQELWGFTKDAKFHRFWQTSKCSCPKMDNDESYPSGYYTVDLNCPLHSSSMQHTKLGKEIM